MWKKVVLDDLLEVQNGYAFNSKQFSSKGELPLIRIRDLKKGVDTQTRYTGDYDAKYIVKSGDFLIGMDGEFRCYEWKGDDALLNQRVCRLQNFKKNLYGRYLFYIINSELKKIEDVTGYTTVKHLSSKAIKQIKIALPPIAEQERIVSKLDKSFAEIDKNIYNYNIKKKELNKLKDKILMSQYNKITNTKKLLDICNSIGGGTPSKNEKDYYDGHIPWATVRDMNYDELSFTQYKITELGLKNSSSNLIPKNNIIIATRVGLGKFCILKQDTAINQDLRAIIPKDNTKLSIMYLFYWFKSISEKIISAGKGFTVKGVNLNFLKSLNFPYCSIEEQESIVKKISLLFKEYEVLISITEQQIKNFQSLKTSLLAQKLKNKTI
jgi:type I restriction enzyme, S subunit